LVRVDGHPISVQLCDTAGQDDFDPLRSLCYPDSDVFLMLQLGTQSDRRRDVRQLQELARYGQAPVPETQAQDLAQRINATAYVETSALTQRDLKEAFDQAIVSALTHRGTIIVNSNHSSRSRHKNGKKKQSLWQKLCCFS
ncbi:hypothetical protein L9F63_001966, partial [Diploptera punctata]